MFTLEIVRISDKKIVKIRFQIRLVHNSGG